MITDATQFNSLKDYLDREAERINSTDFIAADPVQFPRRFERLQDIEIASLLSATIAWGNRKMICNNCEKMLVMMDNSPLDYTLDGAFEQLPDEMNIHRTFFARDFKYYLRGLRSIYRRYASLNDFAVAIGAGKSDTPSWHLVENMRQVFIGANNGAENSRALPSHLENTALKRINMALRWLVRNDGIVDMGVWNAIKPSQLFIPLDVHVGNTARALSLIDRRANDKRTVLMLTEILRKMRPDDPVIYDYALFGIGVMSK